MRPLPRRLAPWLGLLVAVGLLPVLPAVSAAVDSGTPLRAGAAVVDVTWHVGASQGQYAGEGPGVHDADEGGTVDPHVHATTSNPTHGIESRDTVRALVMDDGDGGRWALVTNDLYIPQDLVNQRVAGLLAEHDLLHPDRATGITADDLTISVSHSHSSPFYSSTSWGAWAFQDVFDLRFFEFIARGMADAVIAASDDLREARAAVVEVPIAISKRNPESPTVSQEDEQTPAGWAHDDNDGSLALLQVEEPDGSPIANWVVFGRHPEGMKDNGLHTGEYVGNLLRVLDRELGGVSLFSQNDTGSSEIAKEAKAHVGAARQEYDENSHNMLERVARDLADVVHGAADAVERERRAPRAPHPPGTNVVLVDADAPVAVTTRRFAPPSYRASATVSNCRTERAAGGDVGIPAVGLPDCYYVADLGAGSPVDPGVTYDTLQDAGVPVPDNYGFPSYIALQESTHVVLQAIKLGTAAITVCPCEMFAEQGRNTKSRLDKVDGNLWFGSDWTAHHRFSDDFEPGVAYLGDLLPDVALGEGVRRGPLQLDIDPATPGEQWWCEPDDRAAPTQWTCKDPRPLGATVHEVPSWDAWPVLEPVSHEAFVRWKARMYNDARGWDAYVGSPETIDALEAESEPTDPAQIWGNWTQEEHTEHGYDLVVTVSMTNDYWGYIPTYQQWQQRDYYRKALAGLGPHSADFFATRLSRMAASLNGGPAVELNPKDLAYSPEEDAQTAKAAAIGNLAEGYLPLYEAGLPADGGTPGAAVEQPSDITRFDAASFRWTGGSNYTDTPHARVERLDERTGEWRPFGDGYGEVQVRAQMPTPDELPLVAAGQYAWTWTAVFEAHGSDVDRTTADGVRRTHVPDGTYRFVVDGCARGTVPDGSPEAGCSEWDATGRVQPYSVESEPFDVSPWQGITATATADADDVLVDVGPEPEQPLTALGSARRTFESSTSLVGLPAIRYSSGRYDYAEQDAVDYPDTDEGSPFANYLHGRTEADLRHYGDGPQQFCFRCAFEPWAEAGAVERVVVTVTRGDGATEDVEAVFDPATRLWRADVDLAAGDIAQVLPGGVRDAFGERNGTASEVVRG